eukprot:2320326-Amphidinium_carterae.1
MLLRAYTAQGTGVAKRSAQHVYSRSDQDEARTAPLFKRHGELLFGGQTAQGLTKERHEFFVGSRPVLKRRALG